MLITPSEISALKARVKAECQRRSYNGSVTTYAGSNYNYTVNPTTGKIISKEHYDKIATPLNAINSDVIKVATASDGLLIQEATIAEFDAFLTTLEARSITSSSGDCNSSCTGMCQGCKTTCTGSCTGGCSSCSGCSGCGGCDGGCEGGCTFTCWAVCNYGCTGNT